MKSTKTHNNFIPQNETILISEELANRINVDDVKAFMEGFDDTHGSLTLVLYDKTYTVREIDFKCKDQIIVEGDVYLLHDIMTTSEEIWGTIMIKGKEVYKYKIDITHIKNISNTNFNYTFDILNKEALKQ